MTLNLDEFKDISVEKCEGVLTVTLHQSPDVLRINELMRLLRSIPDDPETRAIILTAAGTDFSMPLPPGASHHLPRKSPPHPLQSLALAGRAVHEGAQAYHMPALKALLEVPQPIISALHGHCSGLTTNLALHCDIVIAADNLEISDHHIVGGIVPGDGGCVIWPLLININRAKEYLMTGDSLPAKDAERIGLVNHVVPKAELMSTAFTLARRLANERPPLAVRFIKHAINRVISHQMELVWELADAYETFSSLTEDAKEARRARAENRPPHFTGR